MSSVPRRFTLLALPVVLGLLAAGLSACGGSEKEKVSGVTALPSSSCSDVEYGGSGDPKALIASDLPMQGDSAERSDQMVEAIRQELDDAGWKAGSTPVALQVCDDSLADTGAWDEAKCKDNATAYAGNPDVLGVIGTYNSGCAAAMIPILNGAPGGGVPMVSPGNTLICLTEPSAGCEDGQPGSLYPSGTRNYARVVPNDAFQGAGLATFAKGQGVTKPFVLYAGGDPTSKGQGETFRGAAQALGLQVTGFEPWDPESTDFAPLMASVKKSGADGVVLAGLLEQNGPALIDAKVTALGPNDGPVKLLAPDGFAQQATIDDGGAATEGMFVSVPGRVPESLTGPGKTFVNDLKDRVDGAPVELYAPYAGQAAAVLLSAIAPDATRAGTVAALAKTKVEDGIVGSFAITPTGDPSVGPISVSVAHDTLELEQEIVPRAEIVTAARGG